MAKLVSYVAVAAAMLLVVWRFASSQAKPPVAQSPQFVHEPVAASPVFTPESAARAYLVSTQSHEVPNQIALPAAPATATNALNERTLVGTKWERDKFALEFGPDGKLIIGGRERAQWRVEGSRIRLYRDATGEEHWLDIAGDKLLWEGQEIGRGE